MCFGVTRGEIFGRVDVNFWRLTPLFREKFRRPLFPVVALGEVVELVQYGCSSLAKEEPVGVPMVRMNNLQNDGWDFRDLKYIELGEEELERYRLEVGDLLFNRTNSKELVGKCDMFTELGSWVFASYLIRVRLDSAKMLPQFAADFLNTRSGRLQIDRLSRQIIGMTNINAEELKEILLPVPQDTTKQRELVAAMDAARAERRAKLAEADALLAGLDGFLLATLGLTPPPKDDRKVFGISRRNLTVLGRIDPGYHHPRFRAVDSSLAKCPHPLLSIGTLCEPPVGGTTPTKGDQDAYTDSGVRFLRILNVRANEFDFSDLNFIRPAVHEQEVKRSQLTAGDVLMTITGRVGTAAVVTADILPANINQHIVRLRLKDPECLPEYLAAYLNTSFGTAVSNRGVTGGNTDCT